MRGLVRAIHHPDRQERPAPAGPHDPDHGRAGDRDRARSSSWSASRGTSSARSWRSTTPRGSTWSSSTRAAPTSSRAASMTRWAIGCGRSREWPTWLRRWSTRSRFEDKNLVSVLVNGWVPGSMLFRGIRVLDGRALASRRRQGGHARPGPGHDARQEGRRSDSRSPARRFKSSGSSRAKAGLKTAGCLCRWRRFRR